MLPFHALQLSHKVPLLYTQRWAYIPSHANPAAMCNANVLVPDCWQTYVVMLQDIACSCRH